MAVETTSQSSSSSPALQSSNAGWLLRRTRGVRLMWAVATCARIANQLLLIAVLVCSGRAILSAQLSPWLWWILVLSLLKAGLRYLEHFAGHWVAFTMLTRMRTEFYDALVPQAPAVAKGNAAAELSERATRDIDRIEVFFAHTVPPAIAAVVVPTITVAWSWIVLGSTSAMLMALASVLMIMGPAAARKMSWPWVQAAGGARAKVAVHLGDSVQGLREVIAFNAGERRLAQAAVLEEEVDGALRPVRVLAGVRAAVLLAIELSTLVVLVVLPSISGTRMLASESATTIAIISALVWIGLWASLRGVDDFVDGLDDALESTERIRLTVDATPAVVEGTLTNRDGGVVSDEVVAINGVSFRYPDRHGTVADATLSSDTLMDITAAISRGGWTFVAGVSGSGKSTLAALIARGWDPGSGSIKLNGVDIRDIPLAELRQRVSLVAQRPYLLRGTLADNLRLSAPKASEQQLWQALRAVDLDEWALGAGLDQEVSTDGANLSGGQIQRLAIARALVTGPELLILDEATSQLDEETALRVRNRISQIFPQMTVLEVSHQVDRIPSSATVLVIDNGELMEQGRAEDLSNRPNGYLQRLAAR